MTTPTPNATIYYSINGEDYQRYTSAVAHNEACDIKAYCTAAGMKESQVQTYTFDLYINKSAWRLVSVDSDHQGNEARLAFDNDINTFWHTEYWGTEPACPHTLVVDMVDTYQVTAFTYIARNDGNQNGMVKAYEVYLSMNGTDWGSPVAKGNFQNTTAMQVARLTTPTQGRYLKFVALSEINGNKWTSAAEIGIQAETPASMKEFNQDNVSPNVGIYDLQGRKRATDTSLFSSLPKGVYIYQGKKHVK